MIRRIFLTLLSLIVIGAQLACNYSAVSPFASPTPSPTPVTPSPTIPPPTPTFTPVPPTDTPPPPPTLAPVMNTPIPATPVPSQTPTRAVIVPAAKARFAGKFEGGTFSFRTNDRSTMVTLKEITLNKAKCANGKTVNTHLTFEDITFFEIKTGSFTISFDRTTVSGMFDSTNSAHGTIYIKINANKGVCEIGPIGWTASASP